MLLFVFETEHAERVFLREAADMSRAPLASARHIPSACLASRQSMHAPLLTRFGHIRTRKPTGR
ncbi:MAG: hypothetical protein OXI03_03810 [Chloroflexota bacterium]|nr:hypothetical protein [Chloroflexota bacterium]MDE2639691.1 hypothetical protein [Chloroflexota bacterium]